MRWEAPPEHRETADAIWRHLVIHRGAGLFLSPADGRRLLDWLDRGVPLADILRAIERAAERRAQTRSRVPLGLGHVSRHLGKPTRGMFRSGAEAPAPEGGLEPLIRALRERAEGDPLGLLLRALAQDLEELPGGEGLAERAMIRVRAFHEAAWEALGEARQEALRAEARRALGDLVELLDERQLAPLVEERARHGARAGYDWLSAATVWDLVGAEDGAP